MRLFSPLFGKFIKAKNRLRKPQNENRVPFQELLPLKLRNIVSGKGDKIAEVPCLQQMISLFSTLKANDFDQSLCKTEISNLQTAHVQHSEKKRLTKQLIHQGIIKPGRDLNFRQLNKFMRLYPNPK